MVHIHVKWNHFLFRFVKWIGYTVVMSKGLPRNAKYIINIYQGTNLVQDANRLTRA